MSTHASVTQVVLQLGGGGLEAVAARLAIALSRRGIPASIVALDRGDPTQERLLRDAGVLVHTMDGRYLRAPAFHYRMYRVLRELRPAVLHTHHFSPLLATVLAGHLAGVPRRIHTEHAYRYLESRKDYVLALRALSRRCHGFVLVGQRMLPYYRDVVRIRTSVLRIIVNGVDVEAFSPSPHRQALRRRLGLPDGILIGAVGRLAPEKNLPLLVNAFADVAARRSDTWLVLAGDGPDRTALEALADRLRLRERILFLGWRSDVPAILPALDISALTSTTEALPMAVLEAMSCGVPLVATDVGDLGDVVHDGETGMLIPSGDQTALTERLGRLVADRHLREHLSARARAVIIANYNEETMVDRYIAAYGLDTPAPRAPNPARTA